MPNGKLFTAEMGNSQRVKSLPGISTSDGDLDERIEQYRQTATEVRRDIVEMVYAAQSGHPGGSLSAVEYLLWLYNEELNVDPENPDDPDRDRLVYSKGHACPVLYALLDRYDFVDVDPNEEFRRLGGALPGHSSPKVPGVEFPSGSLGQGLSYANGQSMGADFDDRDYDVYAILGDGETQEGNIWEAAMSAGEKGLDVVAIVDRNKKQNDLPVAETMEIDPLDEKFEAFGWDVWEVDGHDFESIAAAFEEINETDGPRLLIANTVKGHPIDFMEAQPNGYHAGALTDDEFETALEELGFDPATVEVTTK
ncbi:transketolase protein [Halorhabdus tiamatea SARL4B]|nr:transketolase protein [Halorhabdus tiamatea SARL4B]